MSRHGGNPASPSPGPEELLHVFDLPQIYQKPSTKSLQDALNLLAIDTSFGAPPATPRPVLIDPAGVPKYLTTIISSPLNWLPTDADREIVWDLASTRLSERSGRTAMGGLTRTFSIPTSTHTNITETTLTLHEPALTGDNLGLKTWSSSYMLARYLAHLRPSMPLEEQPLVLELGAGTGLLGLAAACAWSTPVILTDLPSIEPNLAGNVALNEDILVSCGGSAASGVLDWSCPTSLRLRNGDVVITPAGQIEEEEEEEDDEEEERRQAKIILAADSIYEFEHVALLTGTIGLWLEKTSEARVVLAHPRREGYEDCFAELRRVLHEMGLVIAEEGAEQTRDDWEEEVCVVWMVWKWGDVQEEL